MRNFIRIQEEKDNIEKALAEKNKDEYNIGKMIGEMIQLEIIYNDYLELIEWISKSQENKISKETLLSKIRGEVIM